MTTFTPQYITDSSGKKISAVIPIKDFEKIMEDLEELEDIKLYDEAIIANEPSIPIDLAFKQIENKRSKS